MSSASPATLAIGDMGYRIPILQKEGGSYYRIRDETKSIIRISIRLNGTLPGAQQGDFSVNTTVDMTAFTPKEFRHPELFLSNPKDLESSIVNEDVGYDTMEDEPNVYSIENMLISTKPAIAQIKKTSLYSNSGEPMYLVNAIPLFKVLRDGASPEGTGAPPARRLATVRHP